MIFVIFEYAIWPPAMSRDVLPTPAHRWVVEQPGRVFTLDCAGAAPESDSVPWLSRGRIALVQGDADDCTQPNLADVLVSDGYTHVLVRRYSIEGRWFSAHGTPAGLRMVAWFDAADVFAVAAPRPLIYTSRMTGFSPREGDETATWRWMGPDASWTVVNTTADRLDASVDVELSAFHESRRLAIFLDGQQVQVLTADTSRQSHRLGPFALTPGSHVMGLRPLDPPTVADDVVDNGDDRALSFAVGAWRWTVEGAHP